MTNKEAIRILEEARLIDDSLYQYNKNYLEALDMAIRALKNEQTEQNTEEMSEKQTDEDLISKQAVIDTFYKYLNISWTTLDILEKINSIPSVTPKTELNGDLISRKDLLNAIWQKEYGKDYDGINMADIELVIKMDEKLYKDIYSNAEIMIYGGMRSGKTLLATLLRAIQNGTPLPKGHGRLIDADSLIKAIEEKAKRLSNADTINGLCGAVALIFDEQTVVESDGKEQK